MKKLLIILFICLSGIMAQAQGDSETILSWLPSLTLGESADFTNGFSGRGIDFESGRYVDDDLTVGIALAWNVFREKLSDETMAYKDFIITGTQFRYLNTVPVNLKIRKYFQTYGAGPYVGLGLGTSYTRMRTDVGLIYLLEDKWQFNIAPEAGSVIEFSGGFSLALKVKYNYSPKAGDFPAVSYLGFGIGAILR